MSKSLAAQELGRRGGKARAASLSQSERIKQAKHAIECRWKKRNAGKIPVKSKPPEKNSDLVSDNSGQDEPGAFVIF